MKFSELDGRRIALWGLGRETRALRSQLERHLPQTPIMAVIDDDTPVARVREVLAQADVLVRSPGVSIYKPLIREAPIPVTTPTGLWMAQRGGHHVIGVTGTKGKSTTATVIAHLLRAAGTPVELAGNIGRPVIELLDTPLDTWVVCELSSYQIADLEVGPEVAVMTNLYREHTDWHGSEAQYRADKLRIFDLPGVRTAVRPLGDRGGWRVDVDGGIRQGTELIVPPAALPLRGRHNAQNVATALNALTLAGLPVPPLPGSLRDLQALPHRLQTVHTSAGGIEWVDDSISTTPESTIAALEAFAGRPVVLLAGGSDRTQRYEQLGEVLARRPDTELIVLPQTGEAIAQAAARHGLAAGRISTAAAMRQATRLAAELATHDAVILLSPAAPSYNAYRNFEQRGEDFAACAKAVG